MKDKPTSLEKAKQAIDNHTYFNGMDLDDCRLFILGHDDSLYELAHDAGQFNLSEFRDLIEKASVNEYRKT